MAAGQPTTLPFDLGGVLIDWNPRYLYRRIFDDEAEMEIFLSEVCHAEWNLGLDAGQPLRQAVAERVEAYPRYRAAIEAYAERWLEMVEGPIQPTVDLLNRLAAQGTPLFALTNWSSETFKLVRHDPTYSFLDHFQEIVVSGEIKLIKPDPAIFEHTLQTIKKRAGDCLFIDDNAANIKAAEAMGLHVHHFKDPAQLAKDLGRHGFFSANQP